MGAGGHGTCWRHCPSRHVSTSFWRISARKTKVRQDAHRRLVPVRTSPPLDREVAVTVGELAGQHVSDALSSAACGKRPRVVVEPLEEGEVFGGVALVPRRKAKPHGVAGGRVEDLGGPLVDG